MADLSPVENLRIPSKVNFKSRLRLQLSGLMCCLMHVDSFSIYHFVSRWLHSHVHLVHYAVRSDNFSAYLNSFADNF